MNKSLFIAGNWKSNKTRAAAVDWLEKFNQTLPQIKNITVILGVPFPLLEFFHDKLTIAAQDVSPFQEGAYTGEVAASQIKEFANWVIIGHSERRKFFLEDDMLVFEKAKRAKEQGLSVIFCVQDEKTPIPPHVDVVAYEPIWAIGTGKSDTPENANAVVTVIKQRFQGLVIYGGSVTDENVKSFVSQSSIDGVLPGGASLDPVKFANLITAAV